VDFGFRYAFLYPGANSRAELAPSPTAFRGQRLLKISKFVRKMHDVTTVAMATMTSFRRIVARIFHFRRMFISRNDVFIYIAILNWRASE
jgi:hypothetical protein